MTQQFRIEPLFASHDRSGFVCGAGAIGVGLRAAGRRLQDAVVLIGVKRIEHTKIDDARTPARSIVSTI